MRTTVEIRDDQREALAALAARRGLRGFSRLVQEAIDTYLDSVTDGSLKAALALRGSFTDAEAEEMRRRIDEAWSSWKIPS